LDGNKTLDFEKCANSVQKEKENIRGLEMK
jgi:hypothetical protein